MNTAAAGFHARIADDHGVSRETEVQQDGRRSHRILRQVHQHVHARAVVELTEIQGDLLADGRAVETEVLLHVIAQGGLLRRPAAVLVVLEEPHDLGAALLPLADVLDRPAVLEDQRVGQAELVVAYLGLILIDRNARDHITVLGMHRRRAKQGAAEQNNYLSHGQMGYIGHLVS